MSVVQVRQQYRSTEVSAYVLGIVLAVLVVLVWPALMLLAGVLSCSSFTVWTVLVIVLAVASAVYLGLVPPFTEIVQVLTFSASKADVRRSIKLANFLGVV